MSTGNSGRPPALGFQLLDQSEDDKANNVYTLLAPTGATVKLTARQLQIMSLSPMQKQHVPQIELVELGKLLMSVSGSNIDQMLEAMNNDLPEVPEFIPEPFKYDPLKKSNSIRLAQILPDDENGLISIALDEHDLDEHIPSYFCLSYTWGNPHAKSNMFNYYDDFAEDYSDDVLYPVSCNGRLMHVRANLYDALQQLPEAPGTFLKRTHEFNGEYLRMTDLHTAAADGNPALVKMELFRGANINAVDSKGRTALVLAIIRGHVPVVLTLLEAGADPELRDYDRLSPLDHGLAHGRHEIVDMILSFNPARVKPIQPKFKHSGRGPKLWIDAICINQEDDVEKSEQVRVMDRIYSQAAYVVVWLGRDDGTAALAAQTIRKLLVGAISGSLQRSDIVPYRETRPEVYVRAGIPYVNPREWIALATLYLRQAFHRLWCLQETVLPDEVVMFTGEQEIQWHEFLMVTEGLTMLQAKFTIPPSTMFRPAYNAAIESEVQFIFELRTRKQLDAATDSWREDHFKQNKRFWRGEGKQSQIPLLQMIMQTITFQCFDPRDHVYALAGLCKAHPESPRIEIDYAKPWEEVYTEIIRLMLGQLTKKPSLQVVSLEKDSNDEKDKELPTWCFNFSRPGVAPIWRDTFKAAGANSETFDLAHSSTGMPNELLIEGQRVDIIGTCATKRPGRETVSLFNFDPIWPELILDLPQVYPSTQQLRTEVFWRTLCGDVPSIDDVVAAREAGHQDTSEDELATQLSTAPSKYASQFRDQLCASLLAHGEQSAEHLLEIRTTPGGVLLQALLSLTQHRDTRGEAAESRTTAITAPTEDELVQIRDTSLTGPHYGTPLIQQALSSYESIFQLDSELATTSEDYRGCATPSFAEFAAYLTEPKFRIWRSSIEIDGVQSHSHATDAQAMDSLPPGTDGFRSQFARYNGGRRLFVTKDMKYLGLGPMSMQPGDEVWILKGSRVPFLLRRVKGQDEDDGNAQLGDDNESTNESEHDLGECGKAGKASVKKRVLCVYDGERHPPEDDKTMHNMAEAQAPQPDPDGDVADSLRAVDLVETEEKGEERVKRPRYNYIGELYVHGIMHGEAVNDTAEWEGITLV